MQLNILHLPLTIYVNTLNTILAVGNKQYPYHYSPWLQFFFSQYSISHYEMTYSKAAFLVQKYSFDLTISYLATPYCVVKKKKNFSIICIKSSVYTWYYMHFLFFI